MLSNQHIRMISEDQDTEDWSNDAENTDLITEINYIWTYIQIETAVLRDFFQKHKKSYQPQTFEQ